MTKDSIGIDISKAHLDVAWPRTGKTTRFPNNRQGFAALKAWIGNSLPELVVYEATGVYHGAFEQACADRLPLVKVNPLQARRFAQACGQRAKTDKVDAAMLAAMGAALAMEPDPVARKEHHELKELQIERTALVKDRTRLKNRLQTQTLAITRRQTKARLAQIEKQLKAIEGEIATRLDQDRGRAIDILKSIPGIGATTAASILIECPEIGTLGRKQIASLAGLAPVIIPENHWVENWTSPAFDALGERHEEIKIYGKPDPGDFEAG
ncbi:IS110 family transposase [Labrenzia sp. OB1]|uniref:IS110 family transposase n=1 Tax=Labrenzia sp. OB1 TaxID=1561204 RepID=UPI00083801FC|nr:IS110 family transposase [Labrenzia sp. OB1]